SGEICPSSVTNSVARPVQFTSVSAASYTPSLAPGAIVAAFAANDVSLAARIESVPGLPLPESLAGSSVTIRNFESLGRVIERKALLFYASPGQINYYIPADVAIGPK